MHLLLAQMLNYYSGFHNNHAYINEKFYAHPCLTLQQWVYPYWWKLYFVYLQELLYLYGFVIDNNPDDYLMVTLTMMYGLQVYNFIGIFTSYLLWLVNEGQGSFVGGHVCGNWCVVLMWLWLLNWPSKCLVTFQEREGGSLSLA